MFIEIPKGTISVCIPPSDIFSFTFYKNSVHKILKETPNSYHTKQGQVIYVIPKSKVRKVSDDYVKQFRDDYVDELKKAGVFLK